MVDVVYWEEEVLWEVGDEAGDGVVTVGAWPESGLSRLGRVLRGVDGEEEVAVVLEEMIDEPQGGCDGGG